MAEYKIEWTPEKIKALRKYLGVTQQELAEQLGMRQQTISEWETGVYKPRRSSQKFLSLIAERAGFYDVGEGATEGEGAEEDEKEDAETDEKA
jgi:transcriptional regulator with XRE-family HTH domain